MDAKALAKSKRAHSLHHKKKNQTHQGLKAPSGGSDDKKPAGKQAKERSQQSDGQQTKERAPQYQGSRGLPSNWDRYEEDLDSASEGAQASSSQLTESVVPRSKGSDYAHLISEAKAQSQSHYSSDVSPLFDDFISDFTQDFGPMLAAKGKSILSWIIDDSFEFEGKESPSIEAPFLSLNLNALAEQLAKAKLSERLYLQSDLLPLELLDDACEEEKHDRRTHTSAAETNTLSSSLGYNREPGTSTITVTGDLIVQTSEEESNPVKQNTDEILQSQEINRRSSPKPVSEDTLDSTSGKPPAFEAASAEAELDMLLNSFGETTILEPLGASLLGTPSAASGESIKKGKHMMEPVFNPVNIDDAIDNLLEETSSLTVDEQISHMPKVSSESVSSSINSISKSQILDDFDSWLDTI
ncbi:hypothetical protein C2S52_010180 [Perilla frutescens var. hirtella]|nr:hypothetical protein C2S52_010180 [Perilla frutescens var. hirtella]KAH6817020.1 hypothetical protein C2S51_000623 [Perilla frutescens var. frutescens]